MLLLKISKTDLETLESTYRFRYLTACRNKHRSLIRSNNKTEDIAQKRIKTDVLVELCGPYRERIR